MSVRPQEAREKHREQGDLASKRHHVELRQSRQPGPV
jgi:hypothetical protein